MPPATPPKQCLSRLSKELKALQKDPLPNISAMPLEDNILEWHYMILGPKGSPFEGGCYHGKLRFPPEYPFKPPAIYMLTPNGRFKPNTKLCLSMSDFHPETWNPLWSVSSVITGLYTFWLDNARTLGSIETNKETKRRLAIDSWAFNRKDPIVRQLFPELLESPVPLPSLVNANDGHQDSGTSNPGVERKSLLSWQFIVVLVSACLAAVRDSLYLPTCTAVD